MADEIRARIDITDDDLAGTEMDDRVERLSAATAAPLVRPVGTQNAAPTKGMWWRRNAATLGFAGAVGGVLGWALAEVIARPDSESAWYGDSTILGTILFISLFSVSIGIALTSWDGLESKSWAKVRAATIQALPYLVGGAVVGGFLAQKIYETVMEGAFRDAFRAETESDSMARIEQGLHLGRGLGFAVAAAAIGIALGAASKSSKRALNGGIGGAIGGFIGGFLFDYVGEWLSASSGVGPRLVALLVTGSVVGLAIGLVETARREHWLEIVSGGMAGKEFILYNDQTVVGSGPACHITLIKDPRVAQAHLTLERNGQSLIARANTTEPVLINGVPSGQNQLQDGDLIQAGQTVLRYRAKATAMPLPGPAL